MHDPSLCSFCRLLESYFDGDNSIGDLLEHSEFQTVAKRICQSVAWMSCDAGYGWEELFQDSCVHVLEHERNLRRANIPNEWAFFGWYRTLVRNLLFSYNRRIRRLRADGLSFSDASVEVLQVEDSRVDLDWDCFLNDFIEFTQTLPDGCRRAMMLRFAGYTFRQSAMIMNAAGIECSHVTVRTWVRDGLKAFAESRVSSTKKAAGY